MPLHRNIAPAGWHGAKINHGTYAARPVPEVVGQLYFVTSGTNAGRIYVADATDSIDDWKPVADITSGVGVSVTESDSSPDVDSVVRFVFPNGSVTDNGDGSVSIDFSAGSLMARTMDFSTVITDVTELRVPNTHLYSGGSGIAILTFPEALLRVREVDTSPNVADVKEIVVPNGTLTNEGGGTVRLTFATNPTVKEQDGTPTYSDITEFVFDNGTLSQPSAGVVRITIPKLTVEEQDSSPSVNNVDRIIFPNGSVTDNGDGSVEVDFGSSVGLTVKDLAEDVTVNPVDTLVFPTGSVTDNGSGSVFIDTGSSGGSITMRTEDSEPVVTSVDEIVVPNYTLSDEGLGVVKLNLNAPVVCFGTTVDPIIVYDLETRPEFTYDITTRAVLGNLVIEDYLPAEYYMDADYGVVGEDIRLPLTTGLYEVTFSVLVNSSEVGFNNALDSFITFNWRLYDKDNNFIANHYVEIPPGAVPQFVSGYNGIVRYESTFSRCFYVDNTRFDPAGDRASLRFYVRFENVYSPTHPSTPFEADLFLHFMLKRLRL